MAFEWFWAAYYVTCFGPTLFVSGIGHSPSPHTWQCLVMLSHGGCVEIFFVTFATEVGVHFTKKSLFVSFATEVCVYVTWCWISGDSRAQSNLKRCLVWISTLFGSRPLRRWNQSSRQTCYTLILATKHRVDITMNKINYDISKVRNKMKMKVREIPSSFPLHVRQLTLRLFSHHLWWERRLFLISRCSRSPLWSMKSRKAIEPTFFKVDWRKYIRSHSHLSRNYLSHLTLCKTSMANCFDFTSIRRAHSK